MSVYKFGKEMNKEKWEGYIDSLPMREEYKSLLKEEADEISVNLEWRQTTTDPGEWPVYEQPMCWYRTPKSEHWHELPLNYSDESMPQKDLVHVPFTYYWVLPDDPQVDDWD